MQAYFTKEAKKNNSTKKLNYPFLKNIYLKSNTDILNPVLTLKAEEPPLYTAAFLPAFNRYYTVQDATQDNADTWTIYLKVDTLQTYRDYILNSVQYVARSASNYNPDLIDSVYPAQCTRKKSIVKDTNTIFSSTGTYVIGVIGRTGGERTSGVSYYALTQDQMNAFMLYLFSEGNFPDVMGDTVVKSFFNPFQYIQSCTWYPFDDIIGSDAVEPEEKTISFGWFGDTASPAKGYRFKLLYLKKNTTFLKIPHVYTDYRDTAPYSTFTAYMPYMGAYTLDSALLHKETELGIFIIVDIPTGTGLIKFINIQGEQLGLTECQIGCPIQLSQVTPLNLSGIVGGVASMIASGGISASSIASGVVSAVDAIAPRPDTVGSNGCRAYIKYLQGFEIHNEYMDVIIDSVAHIGRPLCEERTLSTLTGYTECSNVTLEIDGLQPELSEIISYMEGGFYIE